MSIDVVALRYRDQVRAYASGWSSVAGGAVARARLYGVRDGVLSPNLLA